MDTEKEIEMITKANFFKKSAFIATRSNQPLSMVQKKLLNVMFQTMIKDCKIFSPDKQREMFYFPYCEVKEFPGFSNQTVVYKELLELQTLKQDINILNKDNELMTKGNMSIVLFPTIGKVSQFQEDHSEVESGYIFEPHVDLLHYMRQDKIAPFARLNFEVCMSFKGRYTTNFYEFLIDYVNSPKIPKIRIDDLKAILSIEPNGYPRFQTLKQKVIDPSLDELRLVGLDISYRLEKHKRVIRAIVFEVKNIEQLRQGFSINLSLSKQHSKEQHKNSLSSRNKARDLEFSFRWDEKKTLKEIYENISYYGNLNYSNEEIEELLDKSDYKKWSSVKKFFDTTTGEFSEAMRPAIFDCSFGSMNFESWADIFIQWKKRR